MGYNFPVHRVKFLMILPQYDENNVRGRRIAYRLHELLLHIRRWQEDEAYIQMVFQGNLYRDLQR